MKKTYMVEISGEFGLRKKVETENVGEAIELIQDFIKFDLETVDIRVYEV